MLRANVGQAGDENERVSFNELSVGCRRRTAAGVFYELLTLKSQAYIHLSQADAYGDIVISAGPNFQKNEEGRTADGLDDGRDCDDDDAFPPMEGADFEDSASPPSPADLGRGRPPAAASATAATAPALVSPSFVFGVGSADVAAAEAERAAALAAIAAVAADAAAAAASRRPSGHPAASSAGRRTGRTISFAINVVTPAGEAVPQLGSSLPSRRRAASEAGVSAADSASGASRRRVEFAAQTKAASKHPRHDDDADSDNDDVADDDIDDFLAGFGSAEYQLFRDAVDEAKGDEKMRVKTLLDDLKRDRIARATTRDDTNRRNDAGVPRQEGEHSFDDFNRFLSVRVQHDGDVCEVVPVVDALTRDLCRQNALTDMDHLSGLVRIHELAYLLRGSLLPLLVAKHSGGDGPQEQRGNRARNERGTVRFAQVGSFTIEVLKQDALAFAEVLDACDFGCLPTTMTDDVVGSDFFLGGCRGSLTPEVLVKALMKMKQKVFYVEAYGQRASMHDVGTATQKLRALVTSDVPAKLQILNAMEWATPDEKKEKIAILMRVGLDLAFTPHGQGLKSQWDAENRYGDGPISASAAAVDMGTEMIFTRDPKIAVKKLPGVTVTVYPLCGMPGGGIKLAFASGAAGPNKDYGMGELGKKLYLYGAKNIIYYSKVVRVTKNTFSRGPLVNLMDKASTIKKLAHSFATLKKALERAINLHNVVGGGEESELHEEARHCNTGGRFEVRVRAKNGGVLPSDKDLLLLPCNVAAIFVDTLRTLGYVPQLVHPYRLQVDALRLLKEQSWLLRHGDHTKVFQHDADGVQSNHVVLTGFAALGWSKGDFDLRRAINVGLQNRNADRLFLANGVTPTELLLSFDTVLGGQIRTMSALQAAALLTSVERDVGPDRFSALEGAFVDSVRSDASLNEQGKAAALKDVNAKLLFVADRNNKDLQSQPSLANLAHISLSSPTDAAVAYAFVTSAATSTGRGSLQRRVTAAEKLEKLYARSSNVDIGEDALNRAVTGKLHEIERTNVVTKDYWKTFLFLDSHLRFSTLPGPAGNVNLYYDDLTVVPGPPKSRLAHVSTTTEWKHRVRFNTEPSVGVHYDENTKYFLPTGRQIPLALQRCTQQGAVRCVCSTWAAPEEEAIIKNLDKSLGSFAEFNIHLLGVECKKCKGGAQLYLKVQMFGIPHMGNGSVLRHATSRDASRSSSPNLINVTTTLHTRLAYLHISASASAPSSHPPEL